jgi:cell division protein FtsW
VSKRGTGKHHVESQLLAVATFALVAFGLVMVYSATSASATLGHGNSTEYLERQAIYAAAGLALMLIAMRTHYRQWQTFAPTLVIAALALCVLVLVAGTPVNGARRWLAFGSFTFQPSELAKLALAVWGAAYLARRPAPRTLRELGRPIGILVGAFSLLVLAEPDLGTAITIVTIIVAMLLIAGTPLPTLAAATMIVSFVGLAAAWFEPYRRARLFAFLNPWDDAQGAGFQIVQALIGLGSGGIFGRGLGQGVQKIHFLPEAHTDMIAAVIGEELGLVGLAALVAGYCAFAYAGIRLALTAKDPFAKRLAAGLTVLVCGQAIINLAAVLGIAPLTGIPLPFVSYGGSALVVDLLAVGILLNIARGHGAVARVEVPDRRRRDSRPRAAGARGGRRVAGAERDGDVRRVARSRRSAARS